MTDADGYGPSRRAVLKSTAVAGAAWGGLAGFGASPAAAGVEPPPDEGRRTMAGVPFEGFDPVRVGIIGLGNRGSGMLPLFLAVPGVRVVALCDKVEEKARSGARTVTDAGQPEPALYTKGEHAYEKLCARDDIDFIYAATPWGWHAPMAIAAMEQGKHVATETPFAMTMRDLWELVRTSEKTRRHAMQLENCCYGRNEMRVLNMAHQGLFGDLLHGAGAYLHDLRALMFSDTFYEDEWRRPWHARRNGDLYPTHGLGPVASYMDVNRGDRLVSISSMSSPALGLADYRAEHESPNDSSWQEEYVKGDLTVSLVQTAQGRVIRLEHDVSNPRPYSRRNMLAGTKGVFEDYPPKIYLEPDMSHHQWGDFADYAEYDHWLWKEHSNPPGGHGGMDYIMIYRLVQTLRLGLVPDIDVYDSAAWSSVVPLSVHSVKTGSKPVGIPDFTRGHWQEPRPGIDSEKPRDAART